MIDLEKVINGLETVFMHLLKMTEVCSDGDLTYYRELLERTDDALALLKAQEPRVMSLEEAQAALHTERVVWTECEEKNGDKLLYVGLHMNGTDYFTMQDDSVMEETDLDDGMGAELYGKKYRLWTSQPTDEQREATPWQV